eukprot:g6193.t1
MDGACGEDFDEAFLHELDAVVAAAMQHSRTENESASSGSSSNGSSEQQGAAQISRDSAMLEQSCSTGGSLKPACYDEAPNIVGVYRWAIDDIAVQDDTAANGSADDNIGQGELTVNCRQGRTGALHVINVLITAAGGCSSAMDIPRNAISRFCINEDSSTPRDPSPAAQEPKPFTLLLGLRIGCSIIMRGVVLHEEPHRQSLSITGGHSRNSSGCRTSGSTETTTYTVSGEDAVAALTANCIPKPSTLQSVAPLALPTATPERRRLAPTEFLTPPSNVIADLPPQGGGDIDGEGRNPLLEVGVPDTVLAKLAHDFDLDGVDDGPSGLSSSSSSSLSGSKRPPPGTRSSGGSDSVGAKNVEIPPTPPATGRRNGWGSGVADNDEIQPVPTHPVGTAEPSKDKRQGEDDISQGLSISVQNLPSAPGSDVVEEETGESFKSFRGDDGDGGGGESSGGRASGCSGDCEHVHRVALPKKGEEADVPDGEWRRPLVASPSNRRRSAAGRRKPKVRDGSRNGSRGSVVLHLDHDNKDEGGGRVSGVGKLGATAAEEIGELGAVSANQRVRTIDDNDADVRGGGGGGWGEGEHEGRIEAHSKKRPLAAGGSRKRGKTTPPPPPPPSSWLALRRALHERYRDSEEHRAAEQTEAEAAERERHGWGGSGTNGARGGRGGEVMYPGLRVFWRQEQAFTYADALGSRLSPADAAGYKVLSFETSATGSRKFLVCDVRRFEEHYPYTALPDRSLLRHLLRPEPPIRSAPDPSPSSPSLSSPPQRQPCLGSVDAGGGKGGGEASDGEPQTNETALGPSATTTSPSLPLEAPNKRQQQEYQQQVALAVREEVSAARVSAAAAGPLKRNPEQAPDSCSSSLPSPQSPLGHVYEIIREGRPCRMYFDLEFARACNPGLDGEELVRSWINVVAGKLHQDFGITVGGANFLDLDSSTPKKFSRHLILHLPGDQLFQDNSHVGRFVNSLADDLESWRPPPPRPSADPPSSYSSGATAVPTSGASRTTAAPGEATVDRPKRPDESDCASHDGDGSGYGDRCGRGALESLWVKDPDGRTVLFADVSVYTRNRCFRLLGSSKFSKSVALRVAGTNQRPLEHMVWKGNGRVSPRTSSPQPRDVARTLLHDSLVVPATLRSAEERHLTVGGGTGQHRYSRFGRSQTHPSSSRGQPQQWSGHGPMSLDKGGRCCSCCGLEGHGRGGSCSRQGSSSGLCGTDGNGWKITSQGFGVSPFPAVDSFLRTLICQGGTRGELRQWSYTASEVPLPPQQRHDFEDSGAGAGLARPRSESAPPVAAVRKLTHQIANNRWCWNIRRAHKSNHVFLVTDLSRGEVRQHCHDQECQRSGYRSNPVRLPLGAAPSKDDLEAFELELGLAAAMRESPGDWVAVA